MSKKTYKNPGEIIFDAIIQSEGHGAWVDFPYDLEELYGAKNLVPIKAKIDGHPYQGRLAKMGGECAMLLMRKDVRAAIGKQAGDIVHVVVTLDDQPRVLEIPPDFQTILDDNPQAKQFFEGLSYSHQREYVLWITEAKREETRQRRMHKAIDMLNENKKQG